MNGSVMREMSLEVTVVNGGRIYGEEMFWGENERVKEWWMVTVVMMKP